MGWREDIKGTASFRGVPFKTVEGDAQVGRRNTTHEFPRRDQPYVEDLGRRARVWQVECYVVGEDYMAQRDALLWALQEPGAGELVHPRYGVLQVCVLGSVSVKEGTQTGGMARFTITFGDAGSNVFPANREDTVEAVDRAANDCEDAAMADYADSMDVAGPGVLQESALKGLQRDLDGLLATVRGVTDLTALSDLVRDVTGVADRLAALIRTPVVLAQSLRSLYNSLVLGVRRPLGALQELQAVFENNARPTGTARAGSTRDRLLTNTRASTDLTRRLGVAAQARLLAVGISASVNPVTSSGTSASATASTSQASQANQADERPVATAAQALALRDMVLAQIDAELETNEPDAQVAAALERLRAAVARDVSVRAELLRERSTFTPQAVLPALVLAHRVYQDASRAGELAERNGVRHATFVPAVALEVLE